MQTAAVQSKDWERQDATRGDAARAFFDRVARALNDGRLDDAEEMLRRSAFSSVIAGGHLLNAMLADRPAARGDGLLSVDRPATLIAIAIARLQTAGTLGGLDRLLAVAAERLQGRKAACPVERARDLSLVAICAQLRHDVAGGATVVTRGAELVLQFREDALADEVPDDLLLAAVCDLALTAFLIGDAPCAAALWGWIRDSVGDPRSSALSQADWGLAIVGTVIGIRDLVSPTMRRFFVEMRDEPSTPPTFPDPWWGMLAAARAWLELDRLDADRGLELTRRAVEGITTPQMVGPMILVHAFALVATGRPRAALEFLRSAPEELPGESPDASWQWRAMVHIVAAVMSDDDDAVADAQRLLAHEPMSTAMTTAYVELVRGGDALTALGDPPDPSFNARYRFLYWILAAGAHAQRGNGAATVAALEHVASVSEIHPVAGVALVLPDETLQAIRATAIARGQEVLLERLPMRSPLVSPARRIELTPREEEVLGLVQRGLTNAQIAAALFISTNTVKFHVANLLRRLRVASREEAAAIRTR